MTLAAVVEAAGRALDGPCEALPGQPLLAACSGGADSVALVAALAELSDRWPLVRVAFVDHGLRPVDAERAAARAAAARAGVPFDALRVEVDRRGNLQAAARSARHRALEALAGDALVATGHTLSDQAETVLERLVRGAGLRGLRAIEPRRGPWVRPLLGVARETTRSLGLPFADDPTNESDRYLRNRLRREVLPALATENPRIEEALAAVAAHVQAELTLVDAILDALGPEAVAGLSLRGLSPGDAETWVRWRLQRERPDHAPPSRRSARALARLLVEGQAGARRVSLGGGLAGRAASGRVTFEADSDTRSSLVAFGPGTYRLARMRLVIDESPFSDTSDDGDTLWLAREDLAWPLVLRRARPDDRVELETGETRRVLELARARGDSSLSEIPSSTSAMPRQPLVVLDHTGRVLWSPRVCRSRHARSERRGGIGVRLRLFEARQPRDDFG